MTDVMPYFPIQLKSFMTKILPPMYLTDKYLHVRPWWVVEANLQTWRGIKCNMITLLSDSKRTLQGLSLKGTDISLVCQHLAAVFNLGWKPRMTEAWAGPNLVYDSGIIISLAKAQWVRFLELMKKIHIVRNKIKWKTNTLKIDWNW